MKTSCIRHENNSPLVIVRKQYIDLFDGHLGAAVMLGYFEYWHNIRLAQSEKSRQANAIAEKHGDNGTQDASLYQFHRTQDIIDAMMGVIGRPAIKSGIDILIERGFLTRTRNPNPRYAFDKTAFYILHPEAVNSALSASSCDNDDTEAARPSNRNVNTVEQKLSDGLTETGRTITENALEITSETATETHAHARGAVSDHAASVFEHWKTVMGSPRSRPDAKRLKLIAARIKDGYTPDQLKMAITGCSMSAWHMGKNNRNRPFNGIDLICRDAAKVDQFLAMYENPPESEDDRREREIGEWLSGSDGGDPFAPVQKCRIIEGEVIRD